MAKPAINEYVCSDCKRSVVTYDRDEGTTPMFLRCRATRDCTGRMTSVMYRCSQQLVPTWEWYRPETLDGLTPEVIEHVQAGGLLLRPAGTL